MKPSRGRVSVGPNIDEGGFGFSSNLVQTRTVRDTAAMLDCLSHEQIGDPFVIPKPAESYAALAKKPARKLKIGLVLNPIFGVTPDKEVRAAVEATGKALAAMGHEVDVAPVEMGGLDTLKLINEIFFFGFNLRLDGYGRKTGRTPSEKTLEPQMLKIYEWSKKITAERFMAALAAANAARRMGAKFFVNHDIWLSPTTAYVSEPWGTYNLSKPIDTVDDIFRLMMAAPIQYTLPHNIMGTPAMSLPLVMHSAGLPIGVQLAAKPAEEHLLLQLATSLEQAMPWAARVPELHVSRI